MIRFKRTLNTSPNVHALIISRFSFRLLLFVTVLFVPPPFPKNKINKCTLGKHGVSEIHGFGSLSAFEQALVDDNVPSLIAQAKKGTDFVKNN